MGPSQPEAAAQGAPRQEQKHQPPNPLLPHDVLTRRCPLPPGRDGSGISPQRGQRREGQPEAEPRAELTPDSRGAELVEEHGRGADRHRSAGRAMRRSRVTPSVATAAPPGWGAAGGQGRRLQQDAPAQD